MRRLTSTNRRTTESRIKGNIENAPLARTYLRSTRTDRLHQTWPSKCAPSHEEDVYDPAPSTDTLIGRGRPKPVFLAVPKPALKPQNHQALSPQRDNKGNWRKGMQCIKREVPIHNGKKKKIKKNHQRLVLTTVRTAAVRRGSLAHPTKFFQTSAAIKYMDFYATQM